MVNLSTVLLWVLLGMGTLGFVGMLVLANMVYNVAMEGQKLMTAMQLLLKETSISTAGIAEMITSIHRLERAIESTMSGVEALIDEAAERRGTAHMPLKEGNFFSTDDGHIKASNINDFIDKLKADPKYMDIAKDLTEQLERELAEEDPDEDSDLPFER